jgi:hypothetical protein
MDTQKENTLCDLIDTIVTRSKAHGKNANISIELKELSARLDLSPISALLFSSIFYSSLRGEFPTKNEIITIIPEESSRGIYLAIQELFRKEIVKSFKNHPRRPAICFYTLDEIDKKIINNEVPIFIQSRSQELKQSIKLNRIDNSKDYKIYLNDRHIGMVYHNINDDFNYSAIVSDQIVTESNSLNDIQAKLNQMSKENNLKVD